jgi:hypothetical protein
MSEKDMRAERSSSPSEPSTGPSRPGVDGPPCSGLHVKPGETNVMHDVQAMALPMAGKATATGLATIGARVGITGRDRARAE